MRIHDRIVQDADEGAFQFTIIQASCVCSIPRPGVFVLTLLGIVEDDRSDGL